MNPWFSDCTNLHTIKNSILYRNKLYFNRVSEKQMNLNEFIYIRVFFTCKTVRISRHLFLLEIWRETNAKLQPLVVLVLVVVGMVLSMMVNPTPSLPFKGKAWILYDLKEGWNLHRCIFFICSKTKSKFESACLVNLNTKEFFKNYSNLYTTISDLKWIKSWFSFCASTFLQ